MTTYTIRTATGADVEPVARPIEAALRRLRRLAREHDCKLFLYRVDGAQSVKLAVAAPGRVGVTMRDVDGAWYVGRKATAARGVR